MLSSVQSSQAIGLALYLGSAMENGWGLTWAVIKELSYVLDAFGNESLEANGKQATLILPRLLEYPTDFLWIQEARPRYSLNRQPPKLCYLLDTPKQRQDDRLHHPLCEGPQDNKTALVQDRLGLISGLCTYPILKEVKKEEE